MYLWIATGSEELRNPLLVGGWLVFVGFLLISALPTLTWGRLRPRRSVRLEVLALFGLVGAALLTEPWWTLVAFCVVYLALLPVGMAIYTRVTRQRAAAADRPEQP
jgi:CDP-diacylglycerol--serine O-phosphatidyltransferase